MQNNCEKENKGPLNATVGEAIATGEHSTPTPVSRGIGEHQQWKEQQLR